MTKARAAAATAAQTAAQPSATAPTETWDPNAAGKAFVARHPAVKQSLAEYGRARAKFQFARFYETVHLTPEQTAKFEALVSDGLGMGTDGPDGPDGFKYLSLPVGNDIVGSEHEQKVRELLGEDDYHRLLEYEGLEPQRDLAVHMAGALWFTDTPLTPKQSEQLVDLLAKNPAPTNQAETSGIESFDWPAVIAKAAGFLSPPQTAVLAGRQADEQFAQAINRKTLAGAPLASGPVPAPSK